MDGKQVNTRGSLFWKGENQVRTEQLADSEIEEMGVNLLEIFKLLVRRATDGNRPPLTEQESAALESFVVNRNGDELFPQDPSQWASARRGRDTGYSRAFLAGVVVEIARVPEMKTPPD